MLGRHGGHEIAMHLTKWLNQHIDFAAAAEADRPGQVVADPVVKEAGRLSLKDRLGLLEDLALQTSAADRTGDLSRLADGHPGSRRPWRTAPGADHRRDRHRVALF